jgi:hypothetical protein
MLSIVFKLTLRLALCLNILKLHFILMICGVPHQISLISTMAQARGDCRTQVGV